MAVQKIVFAVFLIPAVASIFFGGFVLGEVLKKPDRELDMMPFDFSGKFVGSSGAMKIIGLQAEYSKSQPIEITISVSDTIFDCGDLYITIYDVSKIPKEVVTQSGFFGQCYEENNLVMPIDDKFSESVANPGQYELVSVINDQAYKNSLTSSARFTVK
ncbi:MAG: hypothetical protein ACE5RN_03215 [Nitrosopumilaceae archaeon]